MSFDTPMFPEFTYTFESTYKALRAFLMKQAPVVDVGEWHAMNVKGKPELVSREIRSATIHMSIPPSVIQTQAAIEPNLPWAEDQFRERVSGLPLNPGETYKQWPWQSKMSNHTGLEQGKFSHTYMERYWPKQAALGEYVETVPVHKGIRYRYGDLNDVVELLARSPFTRQAVLPVWFPEDTGGVHGGRLPCSLTYQFIRRGDLLHVDYSIRSCDFVRHFRDDVYMTMRLVQWVLQQLANPDSEHMDADWAHVKPGTLTMHIGSLHIFEGDFPKLNKEIEDEILSALS
jgi:hypothetical protein